MKQLKINPEFANLLPPLTDEEYSGLEADIIANGCRDALIVWNDTLIDGHNRKRICDDNGIEYTTVKMTFASDNAAKLWIWKNQGNRRNMTAIAKIELAAKMKPILEAEARERMSLGGQSTHNNQHTKGQSQGKEILPAPAKNKQVRDELAEQAGVSGRTYDKGVYVLEHADEETKDKLRRGEKGVSISGVYNDLKAKEVQDKAVEEEPTTEEKPFVPDPNSTTPNIPRPNPNAHAEIEAEYNAHPELYPRNRVTLKDISKDDTDPLIGALMFAFSDTYVENLVVNLLKELVRRGKMAVARQIVKEVKKFTIS